MKKLIPILLLLVLSGCEMNARRPFDHVTVMGNDLQTPYLFARLQVESSKFWARNNYLELENLDTKVRSLIKFDRKHRVVTVKASPGRYRLIGMVNLASPATSMESEVVKHPIPENQEELSKEFVVEKGKVYYLGDFQSTNQRNSVSLWGNMVSVEFSQGFAYGGSNLEESKKEFISIFPEAADMPIVEVYDQTAISRN